jgi:hypothetical protein
MRTGMAGYMSVEEHQQSTKLLVKQILEHPQGYNWSLQGLGMLRLYLSTEIRLHVWSSQHKVPGASAIHNHPWDFDSYVVAGVIHQNRYQEVSAQAGQISEGLRQHLKMRKPQAFKTSTLHCGAGNCNMTEPVDIFLIEEDEEVYQEKDSYSQSACEIHYSKPEDGTVTLVTRRFTREDVDHAQVFWPADEQWGSAEPRPATEREVHEITSFALERWFNLKG